MNSATDEHSASESGGERDMHLTDPRGSGWTRSLRSGIELLVSADWLTAATAAIRRGPRPELAFVLPGWRFWLLLVSALFDMAWLAAWALIAVRFQSCAAVFFASLPVLKWLLFLVAQTAAGEQRPARRAHSAGHDRAAQSVPAAHTDGRAARFRDRKPATALDG